MKAAKAKLHKAKDPFTKKIGLRIAKNLFDQGKSAEGLAFEADVARSTLREIIAGRSNPRILTLKRIATALGYSGLEDFLHKL